MVLIYKTNRVQMVNSLFSDVSLSDLSTILKEKLFRWLLVFVSQLKTLFWFQLKNKSVTHSCQQYCTSQLHAATDRQMTAGRDYVISITLRQIY